MELVPIGVIHSPYKERGDAPRQGSLLDNEITLEIYPQFVDGLKNITSASHLIVLYWCDRADRSVLQSPTPFSEEPVGVFVSRSPNRPNAIALCVANFIHVEGNLLIVRRVDALVVAPCWISRFMPRISIPFPM